MACSSLCASRRTTPYGPPPFSRSTGPMPPPSGRIPMRGRLVHLDLGDQVAARGIKTRRSRCPPPCGSRCGPRRTRPGSRPEAGPGPGRHRHPRRIPSCVKPTTLVFTQRRCAELVDPAGQDDLDVLLPEGQDVVVASREVADVEGRPRVPDERVRPACRDESDRRRRAGRAPRRVRAVQPPGAPSVELLVWPAARRRGRRSPPASIRPPSSARSVPLPSTTTSCSVMASLPQLG